MEIKYKINNAAEPFCSINFKDEYEITKSKTNTVNYNKKIMDQVFFLKKEIQKNSSIQLIVENLSA